MGTSVIQPIVPYLSKKKSEIYRVISLPKKILTKQPFRSAKKDYTQIKMIKSKDARVQTHTHTYTHTHFKTHTYILTHKNAKQKITYIYVSEATL